MSARRSVGVSATNWWTMWSRPPGPSIRNGGDSSLEESGGGRRCGRRMAGGIGFRSVNRPPAFIYMDLRRATMGALKLFMSRATYMGSDRRRIWPETIKSLDFYGFRAFYGNC
jgi:hypothetical protein